MVPKEIQSHGSTVIEPVIERILVNDKLFKRRDQKLKRIAVNAEIVSKSPKGQSTLVKIEPSSLQYSFIQIYMADLLSPIIGARLLNAVGAKKKEIIKWMLFSALFWSFIESVLFYFLGNSLGMLTSIIE